MLYRPVEACTPTDCTCRHLGRCLKQGQNRLYGEHTLHLHTSVEVPQTALFRALATRTLHVNIRVKFAVARCALGFAACCDEAGRSVSFVGQRIGQASR